MVTFIVIEKLLGSHTFFFFFFWSFTTGYYAVGTEANFVAITSPSSTIEPLFDYDLRYRRSRVANLVHIIRLCGALALMGLQIPAHGYPGYKGITL